MWSRTGIGVGKYAIKFISKKTNGFASLELVTGTDLCCMAWRWRKNMFEGD